MSSSRQDLSVRASQQPLVRRSPWCGARGRVDDEPVAHLLRPGHRVAELEIQHARLTLETRRALCQRLRRADDEQFPSHLSGKSPPTCRSYEKVAPGESSPTQRRASKHPAAAAVPERCPPASTDGERSGDCSHGRLSQLTAPGHVGKGCLPVAPSTHPATRLVGSRQNRPTSVVIHCVCVVCIARTGGLHQRVSVADCGNAEKQGALTCCAASSATPVIGMQATVDSSAGVPSAASA